MLPTYNVVILGPSGSGKTVFLGSMYHKLSTQGESGFFLAVDDAQRKILNQIYTE
ncbi:MAG: ATPase/DNA packaging protein, partial [Dolichospermum sp.]